MQEMDVNVDARKSVALYFSHLLLTEILDMKQVVVSTFSDIKPISIPYRSIFFYQITSVSDIGMIDFDLISWRYRSSNRIYAKKNKISDIEYTISYACYLSYIVCSILS